MHNGKNYVLITYALMPPQDGDYILAVSINIGFTSKNFYQNQVSVAALRPTWIALLVNHRLLDGLGAGHGGQELVFRHNVAILAELLVRKTEERQPLAIARPGAGGGQLVLHGDLEHEPVFAAWLRQQQLGAALVEQQSLARIVQPSGIDAAFVLLLKEVLRGELEIVTAVLEVIPHQRPILKK